MYGVAKSFIKSKDFLHKDHDEVLRGYLDLTVDDFSGNIVSLKRIKPLTLRMTNQRETEDFKNLVEDVISKAIDKASQFTHATHCCGSYEMLCVTFENLRALYEISKENSLPFRYQAIPLVHLYGVAKSLRDSKIFLDHDKVLSRYHHLPIDYFLGNIFPLDWKKPWTMQMTTLKETVEFKNLVEGVIRGTV